MMRIEDIELPDCLREGTRQFITRHRGDLEPHLGRMIDKLERETKKLRGPEGLMVRRGFAKASELWEKFFWARLGEYLVRDGRDLEESMRDADQDLLALDALLHLA